MQLSLKLRLLIFRNLLAFVTSYALRKIFKQYKLLTNTFTVIVRCTNIFICSTDLLCSHKIQKRMFDNSSHILNIEDVYSYWRFEKSSRQLIINSSVSILIGSFADSFADPLVNSLVSVTKWESLASRFTRKRFSLSLR